MEVADFLFMILVFMLPLLKTLLVVMGYILSDQSV